MTTVEQPLVASARIHALIGLPDFFYNIPTQIDGMRNYGDGQGHGTDLPGVVCVA